MAILDFRQFSQLPLVGGVNDERCIRGDLFGAIRQELAAVGGCPVPSERDIVKNHIRSAELEQWR